MRNYPEFLSLCVRMESLLLFLEVDEKSMCYNSTKKSVHWRQELVQLNNSICGTEYSWGVTEDAEALTKSFTNAGVVGRRKEKKWGKKWRIERWKNENKQGKTIMDYIKA